MRVVEIRDEGELSQLRDAWNGILGESASDTIFLTWEWITAWWKSYGEPGALRILLAFDAELLQGIAPLREKIVWRYGQRFRTLSFIGDGSNDSDYLDFIISSGREAEVLAAFLKHCKDYLRNGALLELNEIPESSPNLPFLRSYGASRGVMSQEQAVTCAAVRMPDSWEKYLKIVSPRFRTKIRSVLRSFETNPDISFHFCNEQSQVAPLLESLYALHSRRWQKEAQPGVFQGSRKRLFYETLSPLLLGRGWLAFSCMKWKDEVLACQFGFVYRNKYFQLQEGYDPASEHWNVGIGLRAWCIRFLIEGGVDEYDFLGGIGRHKTDWAAETKSSVRLLIGRAGPGQYLYALVPSVAARARETLKGYLPQRALAARANWINSRRHRDLAREQFSAGTRLRAQWIRSALANCYFHSPMSRLLPGLSARYCLQLDPARQKLRWQGRQQPSVRIIYYHRVNDENDPFFPATSTKIFEQQIRFIARHYRVTSLTQAVKQLSEGGLSEPVVAITLDDGYADNYFCAFPILEKLGLTATIFLTTGSIDSREPLWFEIVALALKRCSQTYVDVETTVPRRLWLRNDAERLSANREIYDFVRCLSDSERRTWLSDVLTRLGGSKSRDRDDKMLTWDQVRLMHKRGIEFGGHTVTHPFCSKLLPAALRREVTDSKERIEQELQMQVRHFAYPSGREEDVAEWNKQIVHEAGYEAAVSTRWGVNNPTTDRMELRRGQPWEQHLPLFAAKFDWYQLSER